MDYQTVLALKLAELTLITHGNSQPSSDLLQILDAALAGGVKQIVIREKHMDSARLLAFASRLRNLTNQYHAKLIIHSQADIAKAVNADGVHLASSDIGEIPAMRNWLNTPKMSLSTSCHNLEELQKSHQYGADFAMLSPVFPTQSHLGAPALGIDTFKQIAKGSPLPIIALGGIDSGNRSQLTGFSIATIRAILDAQDPKQASQALLSA
ncbi:MAG: thiamine phosphate synthase [Mariprofundaceae bacterium]|nr:thiamine phosphate synthase [Mariprofundaceae bacterium]